MQPVRSNSDSVTTSSSAAEAPSAGRRAANALLGVVGVFAIFGVSVGAAAQEAEVSPVSAAIAVPRTSTPDEPVALALTDDEQAVSSEELLDLVETLEDRDARIDLLEGQLVSLRQSEASAQLDAESAERAAELGVGNRITPEQNTAAMELWRAGYQLGRGQNLSAFESTILPCESGSQPNPDIAVGATDDWGRAQINRPTWKARFESLTGSEFESGILDPTLNGFMAAHVEHEQGLSAWTCWRRR